MPRETGRRRRAGWLRGAAADGERAGSSRAAPRSTRSRDAHRSPARMYWTCWAESVGYTGTVTAPATRSARSVEQPLGPALRHNRHAITRTRRRMLESPSERSLSARTSLASRLPQSSSRPRVRRAAASDDARGRETADPRASPARVLARLQAGPRRDGSRFYGSGFWRSRFVFPVLVLGSVLRSCSGFAFAEPRTRTQNPEPRTEPWNP